VKVKGGILYYRASKVIVAFAMVKKKTEYLAPARTGVYGL
jgi:hypothetical protein